jgi:hypothetical protein
VSLRIAALQGNFAHAPRSSSAALISAYASGAWLLGLQLRASPEGDAFVIHAGAAGRDDAALAAIDLGAAFQVDGGSELPWSAQPPLARPQSLGAMLDQLPEGVELLLEIPTDVDNRAALRKRVVEQVRRRGVTPRIWFGVDEGEAASVWGAELRTAARLGGPALHAWLAHPTPAHRLAIASQAELVAGARGARVLRAGRPAGSGRLVAELDDALDDADLREIAGLLDRVADSLSFRSSLRLADLLQTFRALEVASFEGEAERPSRIRLGYAKANTYAHVHQRDGVRVDMRAYDGRTVFGDEQDPAQARLSALEERMFYALEDWPFYSGGGLGTAFSIDLDFTAEVDFAWEVASQATMLEMAVVNVDPPAHRPGWRATDAGREPNLPGSPRDKSAFFDPHGAPPFVGVERDEDDGFRINWNLGTKYDDNRYGRPHGNGASLHGRLRLDRRGAWFSGYYRDDANPDWVCVGACRNPSMNRSVYLRCAAKRWRQETADRSGFMPIPTNAVSFRNLSIRTVLPGPMRNA